MKGKIPQRWIVLFLLAFLGLLFGQFISLLLDFWDMGSISPSD